MQPTNPLTPIQNTDGCATPARTHDDVAAEILEHAITAPLPQLTLNQLRKQAIGLLAEGMRADILAVALVRWNERTDAKPGLLPFLYSDVLKERQPVEAAEAASAIRQAAVEARANCLACKGGGWQLDGDGTPLEPAVKCVACRTGAAS